MVRFRYLSRHAAIGLAIAPMFCAALTPETAVAAVASCAAGSENCPIRVRLRRGTDRVTLRGTLSKRRQSISYTIAARAGQTLSWSFKGPNIRAAIRYPDGNADGPGLGPDIPLPETGTYVFTVSSNLMAEGIYGPFRLTLRIR